MYVYDIHLLTILKIHAMKKMIKKFAVLCSLLMFMSSCYTYTSVVGKGAQGNRVTTEYNHYLVYGLIPVGTSDAQQMAYGENNYTVKTSHTFVCGLVNALTFGMYTPTLTTVIR